MRAFARNPASESTDRLHTPWARHVATDIVVRYAEQQEALAQAAARPATRGKAPAASSRTNPELESALKEYMKTEDEDLFVPGTEHQSGWQW